jgi:quercetin dioxygenase-like cupin family protein
MSRFNQVAALLKDAPSVGMRHEDAPFFQVGNIFSKLMVLEKGQATIGHSHHYDHMTILGKGALRVITPDSERIYYAPESIEIKANVHHALIALEDVHAWCVHDVSVADKENLGEPF